MSVIIKRKTSWLGMGSKMAIKVNNEKVSKISFRQEQEITIPGENAVLSVSQYGSKSNKITVTDGDVVEIKTATLTYIAFALLFVYIFTNSALQNPFYEALFLTVIFGLLILSFFVLNSFKLRKLNSQI